MSQLQNRSTFTVIVQEEGDSSDANERAAHAVADELKSIAGVAVQTLRSPPATAGAKSIDGNLVGLVVAMSGAGALLPTALTVVRDWIVRQRPATKVVIEFQGLKISWDGGTPPEEMRRLIAEVSKRV